MAIRIRCPKCDTSMSVDADKCGKKVRCRECDALITIPGDGSKKKPADTSIEEDRRPVPKSSGRSRDDDKRSSPAKKSALAKNALPLVVMGGGSVLLLVFLVAVGLGIWIFSRSGGDPAPDPGPPPIAGDPGGNPPGNPGFPNNPNPGGPLPDQMAAANVERVKDATVYLRVTMPSGQVAEGSGFFVFQPGLIVTNAHVLGMLQARSQIPNNVQVVVHSGEPNEMNLNGRVLGVDRDSDLAVIRVDQANLPQPLTIEADRALIQTQKVYICGFPFGAQLGKNITVSESSVSSLRKDQQSGALVQVQLNGGMHPGNSGGPVVNTEGSVVGVSVAGIRGTQINFAIPAYKVLLIMAGRLAESHLGDAYVQGADVRLPVEYKCLDPLNRIREMQVEVWVGQPGLPRPVSLVKPAARDGDGQRQVHRLRYQNGVATLDVPLPRVGPGQVCWLQPIISGHNNAVYWGEGIATPTDLAPVERKAANLLVSLVAEKERMITLRNTTSLTLYKGQSKKVFSEKLEANFLESFGPEPRGAFVRTAYGSVQVSGEEDGRPRRLDARIPGMVKQIPPQFIIDPTNKLRARVDRELNKALPFDLREDITVKYDQLCNSYEAVTVPMPNRQIQPQEKWFTLVPMLLRAGTKKEVADLNLTCAFQGTRQRQGRSEALISVAGKVKGRGLSANKIGGDVNGKLAFDMAGGFIAHAQLAIVTQLDNLGGDLHAVINFEIDLTRKAGNPFNIQLPPDRPTKPKGPDLIAGKRIVTQNGVLLPNDPLVVDPNLRQRGSRMKIYPVPMQAGKTYIIDLTSGAFDSYLFLASPTGKTLASDDDGGGYPSARIVHTATMSGLHRVIVSCFDAKTGPFQLLVHEVGAKKGNNPPPPPPAKVDPKFDPKGGFKRPAKSAQPTSYIKIVSPKGDFIGQGKNYDYRGDEITAKKMIRSLNIRAGGWTLSLAGPNSQLPGVGEYLNAVRYPLNKGAPGLSFHGNGRASNRVAGEFVIWELEMDGANIVRLAVDFVQRSNQTGPPLRGSVRINSNFE